MRRGIRKGRVAAIGARTRVRMLSMMFGCGK
jgi:hypothetical protein